MPRKVFVAGEILSASDVNLYLQDQAVMTFAGTAARAAAISTPVEGMVSYLEDSNRVEVYTTTWTPIIGLSNLDDLADVSITSATNGQSLVYDGSNWVNTIPPIFETTAKTSNYTLALADAGLIVSMNVSGAGTVTVPTNGSVAFPTGTIIGVYNLSADLVTVSGTSGVTVRNAGIIAQYREASLRKRGTDEWVMVGG